MKGFDPKNPEPYRHPDHLPILRTSERGARKRCDQKWAWRYWEGLVGKGRPALPLWFGTGIHLALAEWYIPGRERGRNPKDTWAEYADGVHESVRTQSTWRGDNEDEFTDALELGIDMFDGYLREYGKDDSWEVIAPEQTFRVLIPNPAGGPPIADYRGTFDGVYRDLDLGGYYLMEHKSAAQLGVRHLPLDDQAGSYFSVATHVLRRDGLIGPKEVLRGVTYNFLIKRKSDKRPRDAEGRYHNKPKKADYIDQIIDGTDYSNDNPDLSISTEDALKAIEDAKAEDRKVLTKMKVEDLEKEAESAGITVWGEVSKVQPEKPFYRERVERTAFERKSQILRIADEVQIMNALRDGVIPVTKNPTKDCAWDCDFFELCKLHEAGGDTEDYKRIAFNVEDPYADHRDGAENSKTSVESNVKNARR